jgi:hypothetical protein
VNIIINPGSGPVHEATEQHAAANMAIFADDLRSRGITVNTFTRRPDADYGDGRYAYTLHLDDGAAEIQMPGLPVDRVRYLDQSDQNIWDFPRLYVDDSSWVWKFALDVVKDVAKGVDE